MSFRTPTGLVRQQGLSLVELMISLVIGLIIMGAVLQAFLTTSQSYRIHDAQSRIQEDGRAAIHFISQDIRTADFWGCMPNKTMLVSQLDTGSANYSNALHDFIVNEAVTGVNAAGPGNSDSLTLRGAVDNGTDLVAAGMADASVNIVVNGDTGLVQNQVSLISDCLSGDIFQITNNPSAVAGNDSLQHGAGAVASGPGNSSANLSKAYSRDAQVRALQTITYGISVAGGEPMLQRNGVDIVPNIEQMQLLFGEDTDGDLSANYYVSANNVATFGNVVSIRVTFLVRSLDDNLVDIPQAYNFDGAAVLALDNRIRHVFTTTVSIRNRVN